MKKSFLYKTIGLLAFGIMAIMAGVSSASAAGTPTSNVHGYIWSSNIGWISLNCEEGSPTGTSVCPGSTTASSTSNYAVKVVVDATTSSGTFDGYAWSNNVGWVSFRAADVSSCGVGVSGAPTPMAQTRLNLTTNQVSGWARVISGTPSATISTLGGWDGCISMRSASASSTAAYGVSFNPSASVNNLTGYAWGGVNLGWVSWTNATLNLSATTPSVDLKVNGADSASLGSSGGTVALSWVTANLSSAACTASNAWTGSKSSGGGSESASVASNTTASMVTKTYVITCTGVTGTTVSDTVTVTVAGSVAAGSTAPFLSFLVNNSGSISIPPPPSSGTPVTLKWETQNIQPGTCKGQSSAPSTYSTWNGPLSGTSGTTKTVSPDNTYTEIVTIPSSAAGTITFRLKGCKGIDTTNLGDRTVTVTIATTATSTGSGTSTSPVKPWEEF